MSPRTSSFRGIRWIVLALVLVLLAPYVIAPIYRAVDPVSTLMLWRWLKGARVERTMVPLDAIAPVLPVTVMAAEDARFCSHYGIDWAELREAIEEADDGGGGGSTITQQVTKNLFLWQGRSYVRKALELPLAMWIDLVLPKRRILEIYLNIAEWGPNGEFGVEAGARRAFGKSAAQVSPREAALLAAVLPNPVRRNARRPSAVLQRLAQRYEARAKVVARTVDCLGSSGRGRG